jgi:hypothetical protein
MPPIDPNRLLLAAKTSISMIGIIHETLWQLFPNELLILIEADEEKVAGALYAALFQDQHPAQNPQPDNKSSDFFSS